MGHDDESATTPSSSPNASGWSGPRLPDVHNSRRTGGSRTTTARAVPAGEISTHPDARHDTADG